MDIDLAQKLQEQDAKLEEIRGSVRAMKRYFQITFWVTIIFFVLPLLGLLYAVPKAMNSYLGSVNIEDLQGLEMIY
ncbi:MAG: hypothetical protein AAB605_00320 [Patescibacteria group bacterium]